MRRVLLLDTETTGLDPAKDACIEVAAVVYDLAFASPIVSFAALIRHDSNAMEKVNHIPAALLGEAPPSDLIWPRVASMAASCDAILAHNAAFDRGFVPASLRDAKPWICTQKDLDWPQQTKPGQSLVALALAHGLGVASAHRALADCDLLARLLSRVAEQGTDLVPFLSRGLRPKATYQAIVTFHESHKAKDAGFQWEPESKRWLRTLAIEDAANFPFLIRKVAQEPTMSILDDLAFTTITKTAKVNSNQLRSKLGLPADAIVQLVAADDGSPLLLCSWLVEGEAAAPAPERPARKTKEKPAAEPVVAPKPIETDWKGMLNDPSAGNAAPVAPVDPTEEEKAAALVKEIIALELVTPSWLEIRGDIGLAGSAIAAGIVKHDYPKALQYAEKLRAVPKAAAVAK